MASFPQASPPTLCAHFYPPPYAPHALPISFVSILPPTQYWVRSTDHSAPRYAPNNNLGRMWVEAIIVALFDVLPQHVSCGTKEYHEKTLRSPDYYRNHPGHEERVF
jgi:hypothetical protein